MNNPIHSHKDTPPPPRLSMAKLWQDVLLAFDIEKGLVYTFYSLLIRPHKVVQSYLFEDRSRLTNPFKFLAISITLSTFILLNTQLLNKSLISEMQQGFEQGLMEGKDAKEMKDITTKMNIPSPDQQKEVMYQLLNDTFSFSYLIFIPILGLISWIPYSKKQLFFGEHMVIHTYVSGLWNFMLVISYPLLIILPELLQPVFFTYMLGYIISTILIYKHLSSKGWLRISFYAFTTLIIGFSLATLCYSIVLAIGTAWKLLQVAAV